MAIALRCKQCERALNPDDDFYRLDYKTCSGWGHKRIPMKFEGRYECPQCNFKSAWSMHTLRETCEQCVDDKNQLAELEKQKGPPPRRNAFFNRCHEMCHGHWFVNDMCSATCLECNATICSCYGIDHCCSDGEEDN
jgi:hypothetical protein